MHYHIKPYRGNKTVVAIRRHNGFFIKPNFRFYVLHCHYLGKRAFYPFKNGKSGQNFSILPILENFFE